MFRFFANSTNWSLLFSSTIMGNKCQVFSIVSIGNLISACNLKVPEDLSIISFNNSIFARMMNPQLTSIDINAYQLGVEAASQLSKHIENPNLFATKIIVPYFLVKRESCREIR